MANARLTSLRASPFWFQVSGSTFNVQSSTYFKNHYICVIIDTQELQTTKRGYDYESKTSRGNNQVFLLE